MKLVFFLTIILFCNCAQSQWINIGNHGAKISMTSNTKGFKTTSSNGIPGYVNYKLMQTNTDWVYENDIIDYTSNVPGCCWLESIHFVNDSVGIKVNNGQYNLGFTQTFDGGNTWSQSDTALRFNPFQILAYDYSLGFVAYNDNDHDRDYQFYELLNGDINLLYINDSLELGGQNIEFVNSDTGFIVLNSNTESFLFKSIDGGNGWDSTFYAPNFSVESISFGTDSIGYVAGSNGKIFKSEDYGENWSQLISPTTSQINCVDFYNDTVGFLVGNQGMIFKTLDGGITWEDETINAAGDLINVKIVDIKHAYAYDSNGILYKQGSVLNIQEKNGKENVFKIFPNPSNHVLNIETNEVISQIVVYDISGKVIMTSINSIIDVSFLTKGGYVVNLKTEKNIYQSKFIKN